MPDGDIIRGLQRIYQKSYEALFEGKASNDERARSLIKSLQQDIKKKGDVPVMVAKSMGESSTQAINNSDGMIFVDWAALRLEFNRLNEQADSSHYLKGLVLHAGRSIIHDLEHGHNVDVDCFSEAILCRYMTAVYEAEFKERIPPNADEAILERLGRIEPTILTAIRQWAKKADGDESVRKLHLRSLPKVPKIDNLEDLLSEPNHDICRKVNELLQITPNNFQITDQVLKQHLSARDGVTV